MIEIQRAHKQVHIAWGAFVLLRKIGGVAIMGGCARCGRKFFTPSTLFQDSFGAEEYLKGKFSAHDCPPLSQQS